MRFKVEAWDPDYRAAPVGEERPAGAVAEPAESGAWAPRGQARPHPGPWILIDGVERVDAFVWVDGRHPGVLFSFAVGAVVLEAGGLAFASEAVLRRVFVSPAAADLALGPSLDYRALPHPGPGREDLLAAAREARRQAEWALGARLAAERPGALVVHDGPLFFPKGGGPGAPRLGYVKSFYQSYLDPERAAILERLAPGQRTPVFRVPAAARRTPRDFLSWYLRLPIAPSAPFAAASGLVRVETDAELAAAPRLADQSLDLFSRLASEPYRDPRAPANLIPIGGLERELRRRLGQRELVRRRILAYAAG